MEIMNELSVYTELYMNLKTIMSQERSQSYQKVYTL